jgi:hypothetical protein
METVDCLHYVIYQKKVNLTSHLTDEELPGTAMKFPFTTEAEEAYSLLPYLMRPYAERTLDNSRLVFNCRLSLAQGHA